MGIEVNLNLGRNETATFTPDKGITVQFLNRADVWWFSCLAIPEGNVQRIADLDQHTVRIGRINGPTDMEWALNLIRNIINPNRA